MFRKETIESRKIILIKMMQENLKKRCGKDCDTIKCLDSKEYYLDSETQVNYMLSMVY